MSRALRAITLGRRVHRKEPVISKRDFPRGRKTTVGLAVAALVVVMTLATTGTARASHWEFWELGDGDYLYDAATKDVDGNGAYDEFSADLDNDGAWDYYLYNTRYSDALLEVGDYDMDENGRQEFRLQDGDQRAAGDLRLRTGFDYVFADLDQNGLWDRARGKARRIIPRSNIDAITRINRNNASRNLMHRFTMLTGGSLLYPSVTMPY